MTDESDVEEPWHWPVAQLGMIDLRAAAWLPDAVSEARRQGVTNTQIATAIRAWGGVMTKEEKAERGLKPQARLGKAFYDALTEKGREDPMRASRAIVSRFTRSSVWQQDVERYFETREDPGGIEWVIFFSRGPRCCDIAYAHDQHVLADYPRLPVAECDKDFCACRATMRPMQWLAHAGPGEETTHGYTVGQVAIGVLGLAAMLVVLWLLRG